MSSGRVYLDHAATTPVLPEVIDVVAARMRVLGNPSSLHGSGRAARKAVEEARETVAAALSAAPGDVVFTSGGTEADNLAVKGLYWARRAADPRRNRVLVSAVEHHAVTDTAEWLAKSEGAQIEWLPVDADGRLVIDELHSALARDPESVALVSVMWANNEVGTVQPIRDIAERCRQEGVIFHSDAVQAFGKVRIRVDEVPLDLLSLGAHKFGGPKGAGVLFVRDGVTLAPLAWGGGQEQGLRPGTENVAFAVAFATAAEYASREQADEANRLAAMRDAIQSALCAGVPGITVNGGGAERLPHILNASIPDVDQEALFVALDMEGLAVSVASACQSGAAEPSHVLSAMGRVIERGATLRISVGRTTTAEDARDAATRIPKIIERVRAAS
jgi:cysteine desulfurase